MPGRPSASGFSSGAVNPDTELSFDHTAVAGRAIYAVVHGHFNGAGLPLVTQPTATFAGVPMTLRGSFTGALGSVGSAWLFSLPAALVTPGEGEFHFDNSAAPFGASTYYNGWACNVANAPSDAPCILSGHYYNDNWPGVKSFTRSGYGWDPLGLFLASAWTFPFTAPVVLSGGTELGTATSLAVHTAACADDLIPFTVSSGHVGSQGLSLVGFMIPPDEATRPRTGGGFYPWFTGRSTLSNAGTGDSITAPLPRGGNAGAGRECNILPVPGTAHTWVINSNQPVGSGTTVVAEIYRGGSMEEGFIGPGSNSIPTGLTLTLSGDSDTEASRSDLATLLSWAKYERLSARFTVTAGTTPDGLQLWAAFLTESGEAGAQIYGGGPQHFFEDAAVDQPNYKAPLHPIDLNWTTSASNKNLVGINVTQTELVMTRQTDTPVADSEEFFMEKRLAAAPLVGVLQDGSGGSVDTAAMYPADSLGPAIARSRFSLSWAPGDLMSFVGYQRNESASDSRHAGVMRVVVATRGQFMLSGHSVQTNGDNDYVAVPNSPSGTDPFANEGVATITFPPLDPVTGGQLTVGGVRGYLEATGPGDGNSLTMRLRQDLADTNMPDLVLTGSPAAPLAGVVGGNVPYASLQKLSFQFLVSSGPTLQRQFWTIPGSLTPTPERGSIGPHQWIKFPRTIPEVST